MPFFAHEDFISDYTKAARLVFDGSLFPGSYFGFNNLLLYGIFLKFFSLVYPAIANALPTDGQMTPLYEAIYASPQILRTLFILKTPFLLFDLLCGLLFLRFFPDLKQKIRVFAFWWLNPLTIFIFYLQGRGNYLWFLFLFLISVWFWKQKKFLWSFLALGGAISLRIYPLFFLPVYFFLLNRPWIKKIKFVLVALLPLIADMSIMKLWAEKSFISAGRFPSFPSTLATAVLNLGSPVHQASLLLALMVLFYLYLMGAEKLRRSWRALADLSFLSLLPMLALGYFHQQTYIWVAFFFAFLVMRHRHYLYLYLLFLLGWVLIVLDYGQGLTFGLLTPLNPEVFAHHGVSFNTLLAYYFPGYHLTLIGRSLALGIFAYLAYRLVRQLKPAGSLR